MIHIRRISADDADVLRDVRLRALSDTPTAFGSTHARESAFETKAWQDRATRHSSAADSATFLAFDGERCCGIIGCFIEPESPDAATIVSMWVAPDARRRKLATRLIETVEDWARQAHLRRLILTAVEVNAPAIALYQRCGFTLTGETEPYPNNPAWRELCMAKLL